MTEQTTLQTVADLPPSGDALRFKRVEPPAYVERRYVAGDYTIDRGRLGGWTLWSGDPASPGLHGWRGLGHYKTLSAARIAAESHRISLAARAARHLTAHLLDAADEVDGWATR
jgi:hypothetical protein